MTSGPVFAFSLLLGSTADTVHPSTLPLRGRSFQLKTYVNQTETFSLLTPNAASKASVTLDDIPSCSPTASVGNITVGVKQSVVPDLFPELELQRQELYERDVEEAAGLDIFNDETYVLQK